MTRGKLVLITPDGSYWRSTEFNGDMYPNGGIGDDILKYYDENGVPSLEGFRELVADINKKNFGYDETLVIKITPKMMGLCPRDRVCIKCPLNRTCELHGDYMGCTDIYDIRQYNYHTDYTYWFNGSGKDICVKAENGEAVIKDGGIGVFSFEKFLPEHSRKYQAKAADMIQKFNLSETDMRQIEEEGIDPTTDDIEVLQREDFLDEILEDVPDWIEKYVDKETLISDILSDRGGFILNGGRIVLPK